MPKKSHEKWIQGAVQHPGALRAKAKDRGLVRGDQPLTEKSLDALAKTGSTTTKRQVALARTLKKIGRK